MTRLPARTMARMQAAGTRAANGQLAQLPLLGVNGLREAGAHGLLAVDCASPRRVSARVHGGARGMFLQGAPCGRAPQMLAIIGMFDIICPVEEMRTWLLTTPR